MRGAGDVWGPLELVGLRLTSKVCLERELGKQGPRDLKAGRGSGQKTNTVSSASGACSGPKELHTTGALLPPRGPAGDAQVAAQEWGFSALRWPSAASA